jgi:hypothetical protein
MKVPEVMSLSSHNGAMRGRGVPVVRLFVRPALDMVWPSVIHPFVDAETVAYPDPI